jgi:hypothetical protein
VRIHRVRGPVGTQHVPSAIDATGSLPPTVARSRGIDPRNITGCERRLKSISFVDRNFRTFRMAAELGLARRTAFGRNM